MPPEDTLLKKRLPWPARCVLFLLVASLWPGSVTATTSVTATKDCSTLPCTVVLAAPITILVGQTIQWQATYTGTATQGHSFYLTTSPLANLADIPLTTSGQPSGTHFLPIGTYYISIKLALMGPGAYTVTFNPSSTGDPHITTINGMRYDFQSVGEFVLLRHPEGLEIQTRQAPVATVTNPGPDPYDGLAMCVSINTAVAARVGKHRVTYEPNLSGVPDPSGLQLRVDGVLTTPGPSGIDLGNRGRITNTPAPGGLEIDFPDGSELFVTPGWWADQGRWYVNLDIAPAQAGDGLAGPFAPKSWLPALPDGTSMGPMPTSLHDRYVGLYQKFADAWRVTSGNSLFDYAPGTSTDTFTMRTWPPEQPPCAIPGAIPVEAVSEHVAKQACQSVTGENAHCVFDVMVTGNPGFATTYAFSQGLQANPATKPCNWRLVLILGGLLLLALILLIICWLRR
jgi:hypothetical protein